MKSQAISVKVFRCGRAVATARGGYFDTTGGSASGPTQSARLGQLTAVMLAATATFVGCGGQGASASRGEVAVNPPATPALASKTIVSLTFDDGNELLWPARDILAAHHMRGTFFIISPRIGQPHFLTMDQLNTLQRDGHEIGGHTLTHPPDLASMSPEDQRHEICDDRKALLGWGFPAESFAYPYDAWSEALESVVVGCGYSAARMSHGIRTATRRKFPVAESVPPEDPAGIRAVTTIDEAATLEELQKYVTDAQAAGGGWVTLIFHRFCDPICWHTAITPKLFADFASWLSAQDVAVLPIREAMARGRQDRP